MQGIPLVLCKIEVRLFCYPRWYGIILSLRIGQLAIFVSAVLLSLRFGWLIICVDVVLPYTIDGNHLPVNWEL